MFFLITFFLFAEFDCEKTQTAYLDGSYKDCISYKSKNSRCEYIRSLCYIAQNEFEEARFILSNISTKIKNDDELLYLVYNSLIEIAYLSGEYKKAVTLSKDSYKYCSNLLSYPCGINKILNIKAAYESKDVLIALKLNKFLENSCDEFFYYSIVTK